MIVWRKDDNDTYSAKIRAIDLVAWLDIVSIVHLISFNMAFITFIVTVSAAVFEFDWVREFCYKLKLQKQDSSFRFLSTVDLDLDLSLGHYTISYQTIQTNKDIKYFYSVSEANKSISIKLIRWPVQILSMDYQKILHLQ